MAKLPFGVSIKAGHVNGLNYKMDLVIQWYAWPFLFWKAAHQEYCFKWWQYPWLITIIIKHTILKWIGNDE